MFDIGDTKVGSKKNLVKSSYNLNVYKRSKFNLKTIIPFLLVEYETGYLAIYHLISNAR